MASVALFSVAAVTLVTTGCVQRTIQITSEPSGALVYLNDEEVGRTPLTVPFMFYGTYDVRIERDGYDALWTDRQAKAPWWEAPGPDLIAEAIPNNHVELQWHFQLNPTPIHDEENLIQRAHDLRQQLDGQDDSNQNP